MAAAATLRRKATPVPNLSTPPAPSSMTTKAWRPRTSCAQAASSTPPTARSTPSTEDGKMAKASTRSGPRARESAILHSPRKAIDELSRMGQWACKDAPGACSVLGTARVAGVAEVLTREAAAAVAGREVTKAGRGEVARADRECNLIDAGSLAPRVKIFGELRCRDNGVEQPCDERDRRRISSGSVNVGSTCDTSGQIRVAQVSVVAGTRALDSRDGQLRERSMDEAVPPIVSCDRGH
eukprot:1720927-Prymnesium_polylepis.2